MGGYTEKPLDNMGAPIITWLTVKNGILSINIDPYKRIKKFTKVSALTIRKKSGGEGRRP